ncbi:helix-turn-helix domain-containing protein [Embleya sp. NBC_00896]|uniref:helix-turn-helix domain-containing protein n=1 Tax=Embleya sp. NBC_00896 TaxID=2975961 RepID=UPI002F91B1B2|nr:helix-turn-helix domain-containing protein [Embleya sp. NBC_00896]
MTTPHPLGEFLLARRARLQPGEVGLPVGTGLRRTQGLRREELAALAGLSIQYYTRLEQGRETNPGGAVLDRIAAALRLNDEEHAHLYALANHAAERVPAPDVRADREVRPGIAALLERVRPWPAYLLTRTGDILAINPEALALFPGLADWEPERRNTIRYLFLHPAARELFVDWERAALGTTAELHALLAADPQVSDLVALVDELKAGSPEFVAPWNRYDVGHRRADQERYRHPLLGDITLAFEVLWLEGGQRITIHQPPDPDDDRGRRALRALSRSVAESHPAASG